MISSPRTQREDEGAVIGIRVAVYQKSGEPEITEIAASNPSAATVKFTRLIMDNVRGLKGRIPERAVREIVENLIHADYRGVIVSILEGGNCVRVSDNGPGIEYKDRAMQFGFSGSSAEAAREIRGVGAGLGIARATAEQAGGTVKIEDNLGGGTVVTISAMAEVGEPEKNEPKLRTHETRRYLDGVPRMNISERQQKVLITVLECGEIGPSTVAERLEISVSTAYRDLSVLEEHGLVSSEESGKRVVTPLGHDLVEVTIGAWVK